MLNQINRTRPFEIVTTVTSVDVFIGSTEDPAALTVPYARYLAVCELVCNLLHTAPAVAAMPIGTRSTGRSNLTRADQSNPKKVSSHKIIPVAYQDILTMVMRG